MRRQAMETIEFAYHGQVYTIWAVPGPDSHCWRFGCQELGVVHGAYATAQDALLGGIDTVIRQRTRPQELAA